MSEKVASHSGVTRPNDASSGSPPSSAPGRLISNRVFVGNIPPNLVERDLIMLFHRFGKIRDVKIIPEHTRNKSYGFVTFFSETDARRAIQASVQNDSVMWGDRKLNVAPAIKRVNSNTHSSSSSSSNGFYQPPRVANSPYYANTVPVPAANAMYSSAAVVSPADVQHPQPDHGQIDPNNNGVYQAAMICRLPHQYAMTQCHQYSSSSSGHYFVSPGFQPYVQTNGSPIPAAHQAAHYASYASITAMPMTPPCSSASRDNSLVTDGQSDMCGDTSAGDNGNSSQGGGGEKNAVDNMANEPSNEGGQPHQASLNSESAYPLHTTIMCCPHHSCMLSPISPIQHMPNQGVTSAGLARSCLSLHGHPAASCPYPPNSPLIYSSPIVYNPARRSSSARLQRWNSLDANLTGLSHHQHQHQNGYWGNESAWSRPSLDDSYGSEAGLYQGPRGFERPLRPAFSCQSHHGGMFSPFCRSYEYNIWGQGHASNGASPDYADQSGSPNTSATSQVGMSAQSNSNMALNLNETGTEQVQQNSKK